ncbi:MAG: hypothetical protein ACRBI6_03780 [Acidimicrobiales bacterium]
MTLRVIDRRRPGRRLRDVERAAYVSLCPADRLDQVRIIRIPFVPGGFAGITLGTTVCLTHAEPADGTSKLIAHELVHVRQWGERGVVGFLRWYLADYARNLRRHRRSRLAYLEIEAEREARLTAALWARRELEPTAEPPTDDSAIATPRGQNVTEDPGFDRRM